MTSAVGSCSHIPLPCFSSDSARLFSSFLDLPLADLRANSDIGPSDFITDEQLAAKLEEEEELRWMLEQQDLELAQRLAAAPEEWDMVGGSMREPELPEAPVPEQDAPSFTDGPCGICMEQGVSLITVGQCGHAFCHACLNHYVTLKIRERTAPIRCCALKCPEHLSCALVRQVVGEALASDHEMHLAEAAMKNKIYCPFPNCGAAYDLEEGVAEVRCLECNRSFCGTCRVPWHEGYTCKEFNKLPEHLRTPEDAAFMRMAEKKHWRRCPSCRNIISKHEDDCNWIRCRCGCAFCFRCGEKYLDDIPQASNVHGRAGCSCPLFNDAELEGDVGALLRGGGDQQLLGQEVPPPPVGMVPLPSAKLRRHQYLDLMRYSQAIETGYCQCPKWLAVRMERKECPYCARVFPTLDALNQHLVNTKQHAVYACCGRVFLDSNGLLQHAQQRHRRR